MTDEQRPAATSGASSSGASSLAQHLLCAVPQLLDPNFVRSVILIVDHTSKGAFGLVLNNALPTSTAEMASAIGLQWAGPEDAMVRLGGPVEPSRGFILHDRPEWDPLAEALTPELFLTTSLDAVKEASDQERPRLAAHGAPALAFLGYAGWGPGQLEAEMAAGSWMPVPLRPEGTEGEGVRPSWLWSVDPDGMWAEALQAIGINPAWLVGAPIGSGKVPQA